MNLLFVLPEYYPHPGGGIATYYLELLPELVKQGHSVKVLVGSGVTNGDDVIEKDGVKIEYLQPERFWRHTQNFSRFSLFPELQKNLAAAWAIWEQANEGQGFDFVETTDWGLGYAPWILQADGPRVAVTLHGSIGQIEYYEPRLGYELHGDLVRMLETGLLESADLIFSHSNNNSAEWQELVRNQITYIPPAYQIRQYTHNETDGIVRVVGRIQHWKGPEILCQALEQITETLPAFEWIGRDTDYKGIMKSTSSYLQQKHPSVWNQKIKTTGALPYGEVQNRMVRAKFGVVPSIWDVFNYTCVEWMNAGKTVICSEGAGASHLIEPHKNGFTFPTGDAKALAEILVEVNRLPQKQLQNMGNAARETVKTVLNPAAVAKDRVKAYAETPSKTGRKSPNFWLKTSLSPAPAHNSITETLNHLPLKVICKYTLNRTLQKLKFNG